MGLLNRLRMAARQHQQQAAEVVYLHEGADDLEVVGEAQYQNDLWQLCGATPGERVRKDTVAVLVPEPQNTYDPNAIAVYIQGRLVGYLPHDIAGRYLSGLQAAMARCGGYVALRAVITGGGYRADGYGRLGVWLKHDPLHFGIESSRSHTGPPMDRQPRFSGPNTRTWQRSATRGGSAGNMRSGLSAAIIGDGEDGRYDLSWLTLLPGDDAQAVAELRKLLAVETHPIDRHFQFSELEARLYRMRRLKDTALLDYDDACRQHDAEMDGIREAFIAKWGKVPVLDTYRQMAIRQAKQQDWASCIWWAERGLALYGESAARTDAVEDLAKRRNRALSKVALMHEAANGAPSNATPSAALANQPLLASPQPLEVLSCSQCGASFARPRARGRKAHLCPACRNEPTIR